MDPREIVNQYYDAWQTRSGDMTGVPLADDFAFSGPVASFDTADGFRAMALQAGAAVRSFRVRHQFSEGDLVCSIVDWEMEPLPGTLTAAEVLRVTDGTIVRGELIYDAERLRRVMAQQPVQPIQPVQPGITDLLERSYRDTAGLYAAIGRSGWSAQSPCAGWTVRNVGNHLVASLTLLARVVEGDTVRPAEFDADAMASTDLGPDPAAAFEAAAKRSVAAFAAPEALGQSFAFPPGPTPGVVLAQLSLLESLVHGWDLARGAGVRYQPDDAVVAAVHEFAGQAIGDAERAAGLFGPPLPTAADADRFTALLGHLGRQG
jgi:uncharacterized protein (TIGR03086 family)